MKRKWMPQCFLKCRRDAVLSFSVLVTGATVLLINNSAVGAQPAIEASPSRSESLSMDDIDHSQFDSLLKKYVDSDGFVDYTGWKNSKKDRQQLLSYLSYLSTASRTKTASKNSRLAYWINAYNALTIEGILRVYPTTSIRKHTSKFGGYNIWKDLPLHVDGKAYSLNTIENDILRKMGEPRIHFAIVCASISCPRLLAEAYTSKKLDKQLAKNATDFFSRSKNLQVDNRRGTLYLSSILKWFSKDFGGNKAEMLQTISPYLPKQAKSIAQSGRVRIKHLDYNWNLNDRSKKPRTASRR